MLIASEFLLPVSCEVGLLSVTKEQLNEIRKYEIVKKIQGPLCEGTIMAKIAINAGLVLLLAIFVAGI